MTSTPEPAWRPVVSIVVPMLDELGYIERCLDGLAAQRYPLDLLDVIVVDGGSCDGSRELVESMAERRPWLRLVDNPDRIAAAAFNRGIEAAKGEVVCLVAAHGEVGPDFVELSVRALAEAPEVGGVGGALEHEGVDARSRAIGAAMTSPFGMASPFRYARERRLVDTIGHPAYRRAALDAVGPFDETLLRNSDYELNFRLRQLGFGLLFDPAITTTYRPRTSLRRLGTQFYWYGKGKAAVVRAHPSSLRPRHLAPPVLVAGLVSLPWVLSRRRGRYAVALAALGYGTLLAAAARRAELDRAEVDLPTFVAAFPIMHATWGTGFLVGLVRPGRR